MPAETIQQKAARLLGDPIDPDKLLHAIENGLWTPEDAKALRDADATN